MCGGAGSQSRGPEKEGVLWWEAGSTGQGPKAKRDHSSGQAKVKDLMEEEETPGLEFPLEPRLPLPGKAIARYSSHSSQETGWERSVILL